MLKMQDGYVPRISDFVTMIHESSNTQFTGMFKRLEMDCVKLSSSICYNINHRNVSVNMFGFVPTNTHDDNGSETVIIMREATNDEIELVKQTYGISSFLPTKEGSEITDMSKLEDGVLYKLQAPNEPTFVLATHASRLDGKGEPAFYNYVNVSERNNMSSELIDMPLYIRKGAPSKVYVPTETEKGIWGNMAKQKLETLSETLNMVKDSIEQLESIMRHNGVKFS